MHIATTHRAGLLLAALLICTAPSHAAEPPYDVYANWRYSYQIAYPPFLVPQGVSDAGDGQFFRSKNGDAALRVSGYSCIDERDYPSRFLKDVGKKEKANELSVSYRHKTRQTAVASGYRGTRIFYAKVLFENGHCSEFELEYDADKRAVYDKVAGKIAASFKPFDEMPVEVR